MSDKKALTSPGGHGKFHVGDEDDYGIPSGSGHQKSAFFSTWISRLGGSQPRRGSVGFNEQTDFPPNRFAEEENSNSLQDSQKMTLNFGLSRKRNESFSENFGTTPGEDCDSYFLKNKFRRNDSDDRLQEALNNSASMGMSDGMFKLELTKSDPHLPTLEEGKILTTNNDSDITNNFDVEKRAFGVISDEKSSEKTKKKKTLDSSEEGKIFLIDLEEIKSDSGKTVLKPTSRKFSAMSIFQSKLTNNWFFRNKNHDDSDNLVNDDENEDASGNYDSGKKNDKKRKESREEESPERDDGPLLTRIKDVVEKNNAKHREMNFWQPQGT